jgi:Flp pilus assembly protein TadD
MGPPLAGRIVALDRLGRHDEARAELKEAKSRHLDIINVVNNWKVSYRDDLISGLEDVGD